MPYAYKREPLIGDEPNRLANACQTADERIAVWTLLDTGLRVSEFSGERREAEEEIPRMDRPLASPGASRRKAPAADRRTSGHRVVLDPELRWAVLVGMFEAAEQDVPQREVFGARARTQNEWQRGKLSRSPAPMTKQPRSTYPQLLAFSGSTRIHAFLRSYSRAIPGRCVRRLSHPDWVLRNG